MDLVRHNWLTRSWSALLPTRDRPSSALHAAVRTLRAPVQKRAVRAEGPRLDDFEETAPLVFPLQRRAARFTDTTKKWFAFAGCGVARSSSIDGPASAVLLHDPPEDGRSSVGSAFRACLTSIKQPDGRAYRYTTDTIRSRSITE